MWSSLPLLADSKSPAPFLTLFNANWESFTTFYDHLTLHIVPGPRSWSYFLPFLLLFIVLLIPPSILSRRTIHFFILPLIYSIQAYVWIQHQSFDVISMNHTLATFMLLGWYDVRKDFQYIIWQKEGGKKQLEGYPSRMVERIRWVFTLFFSLQLKDFLIGNRSHDQKQLHPVKRHFLPFLAETVKSTTATYTLLDITSNWIRGISNSSITLFAGDDFLSHIVQAVVLMGHIYAALSLYNAFLPTLVLFLPVIFFPSLRHNAAISPLALSHHFGAISSIWRPTPSRPTWGLRAFWGTFWHQNMRYLTSTPGLAVAHGWRIPTHSLGKYAILTISAFFFSGVVHAGMVPSEPLGTEWTVWQLRVGVAAFFWLQVPGLAVEALLSNALAPKKREVNGKNGSNGKHSETVSKADNPSVTVQLGMAAWTAVFLTASAYYTVFPVGRELGWWTLPAVPVSGVAWLQGRPQWWQKL